MMKKKSMNEMEEEDLNLFRKKIEEEFEQMISRGEDVRSFLYFPFNFLTEKVKSHLDELLLTEAYKEIEAGNINTRSFLVYQDSLITVNLEKKHQQIELLERLLDFLEKNEEYEKCKVVQNLLNQII